MRTAYIVILIVIYYCLYLNERREKMKEKKEKGRATVLTLVLPWISTGLPLCSFGSRPFACSSGHPLDTSPFVGNVLCRRCLYSIPETFA